MKWNRVRQFVVEMCKTWGAILTGGFIIAILASWQITGHNIHTKVGWTLIIGGVLVAAFQVWNKQVDISEKQRAELTAALDSSKLVFAQKKDTGYYGIKRQGDGAFFIYVTMFISNPSNKANSIVQYAADIMKTDGVYESLELVQGETDDFKFCVTPVNIPAYGTVEVMLGFISVQPAKYGQPFKLKLSVIDTYGNRFSGDAQF